jgi:hypothetical protein
MGKRILVQRHLVPCMDSTPISHTLEPQLVALVVRNLGSLGAVPPLFNFN